MTDRLKQSTFSGTSTNSNQEQESLSPELSIYPPEQTDHTNLPESALFRAVVCQAITDVMESQDENLLEVALWIKNVDGSGDFDTVCHFAGINEDLIRDSLSVMLQSPKVVRLVLGTELRDAISSYDCVPQIAVP